MSGRGRQASEVTWLLVGLGNPGQEHATDRHNVGWRVIEEIARRHGFSRARRSGRGLVRLGDVQGRRVALGLPLIFMNHNGIAVREMLQGCGVAPERLCTIHDDLDLPVGRVRLKETGGDAGHKGVGSVLQELETDRFFRIRIGIGRPPHKDQVVEYVLSPFAPSEEEAAREGVERAADLVEEIVRQDRGAGG